VDLPGQTGVAHALAKVLTSDAGSYTVRPPVITSHLLHQSRFKGEDVLFRVEAKAVRAATDLREGGAQAEESSHSRV
jgi:hypothetical protein